MFWRPLWSTSKPMNPACWDSSKTRHILAQVIHSTSIPVLPDRGISTSDNPMKDIEEGFKNFGVPPAPPPATRNTLSLQGSTILAYLNEWCGFKSGCFVKKKPLIKQQGYQKAVFHLADSAKAPRNYWTSNVSTRKKKSLVFLFICDVIFKKILIRCSIWF